MAADADVAVILGAALRADGSPGPALLRRIDTGVALFRQGRAGHLLLSGGVRRHDRTEASEMRRAALAAGVPEDCLTVEDRSRDTLENALFCRPILAARGWTRVLLVTDAYHLPRALYTFRRFGVAARAAAAAPPAPVAAALAAGVREVCAFAVYLWRVEQARYIIGGEAGERGRR
jgi:uncharacterized SAM-binding protein YcdF (DUF218 family)